MTDLDPPGVRRRLGEQVNHHYRCYTCVPSSSSTSSSLRFHFGELFIIGVCITLLFVFVGWSLIELLIVPIAAHPSLVTTGGVVMSGLLGITTTGYFILTTLVVDTG